MELTLTPYGNQATLTIFGTRMTYCGLFDETGTEITAYINYSRQAVQWTFDGASNTLKLTPVSGQTYGARFNVPTGKIKYIGFFDDVSAHASISLILRLDLQEEEIVYESPDIFDVDSVEIEGATAILEVSI